MKNLIFSILIIIFGVVCFAEDAAILTTKNGKILENYSISIDYLNSLSYYKIINNIDENNIIKNFFAIPDFFNESIIELINMEIKNKYLEDKGLNLSTENYTLDSTEVNLSNIKNEKIKKTLEKIFVMKKEQDNLLLNELKKENNIEDYIKNNEKVLKEKYNVFVVNQYPISKSSTDLTSENVENIIKNNESIKKYVVYNSEDLSNFNDFNKILLDNMTAYTKDNYVYTVKKITDPNLFLNYDIKNDIEKMYENYLLNNWKENYPKNFDFILVYKPLKIEHRVYSIEPISFADAKELRDFYSNIIFNEDEVPNYWYLSYYYILDKLVQFYTNELNNLNDLENNLPDEYFSKNYSELENITDDSTNVNLVEYINKYKNFIYKNNEIKSKDDYLKYIEDLKNNLNEHKKDEIKLINIIISKDYDFYIDLIGSKFSEDPYLIFYKSFYNFLISKKIDKDSEVYQTLINNIENRNKDNGNKAYEDLVSNIKNFIGDKGNE